MLLEGHFGSDCRSSRHSEKYPSFSRYSAADFLNFTQEPIYSTELKVRRLLLLNFEAGFFSNYENSVTKDFEAVTIIYSEKVEIGHYWGLYFERESQEALETILGVYRRNSIEAQRFAVAEAARPVQEVRGELPQDCWIYLAQSPVRLTKFG